MRDFRIDYTNKENPLLDGNNAGNQGEHNATRLIITPPEEMSDCADILVYKIAFELTNNRVIHSDQIEKADTAEMLLPMQITSSPIVSIQLEGYGADGALIAKSAKIAKIMFSKSVCGTEVDYKGDPFGASAELAANSAKLAKFSEDSNGNLMYNGKAVGGTTNNRPTETAFFLNDFSYESNMDSSRFEGNTLLIKAYDATEFLNKEIAKIEFSFDNGTTWIDVEDFTKESINTFAIVKYTNGVLLEDDSGDVVFGVIYYCSMSGSERYPFEIENSNQHGFRVTYYTD